MAQPNQILAQAESLAEDKLSSAPAQAVQSSLEAQTASIASAKKELAEGRSTVDESTQIITDSMQAVSSANQTIQLSKDTAQLQLENQTQRVLAAGGGIEGQVDLMLQLSADSKATADLLDERGDIMDDEFTGFVPIDSIINRFRAKGTNLALKEAAAQEAHTINRINNVTSAQERFHSINTKNKQTVNAATISANQKKIAATATSDAAKQDIVNVQTNASMLAQSMAMDEKQSDNLLQVYKLQGAEEGREADRESRTFQREQFAQRKKEWEPRLSTLQVQLKQSQLALETAQATNPSAVPAAIARNEKNLKEMQDYELFVADQVTSIQNAQSLAGVTIDSEAVAATALALPATREKYTALARIGREGVLGFSPAEARRSLKIIDSDGLAPDDKYTDLLDDAARLVMDDNIKAGTAPPDPDRNPEAYDAEFDAATKSLMKAHAKEIKAGDQSNPFQAPPMDTVAGYQRVAQSKLWKEVLSKKGMVEIVPEEIVVATIAAIKAKVISPEEGARGIVDIFSTVALHNNTAENGFSKVGLAEYNQTTFNTAVRTPTTGFDLLKATPGLVLSTFNPSTQFKYAVSEKESKKGVSDLERQLTKYKVVDMMDKVTMQNHLMLRTSSLPIAPASTAT